MNEPLQLEWSQSVVGNNGKILHLGNTVQPGQGANVSLSCLDQDGNLLWQSGYNSAGNDNDFGISLVQSSSGDIYALGTTENGTTTNHDILLLKFDSIGNLTWSQLINSVYNLNDIGTELILSQNEDFIYISASSEETVGDYDLLTMKYDISGNMVWQNRYDHNALVEIPTGIRMDNNGGVYISAASGSTMNIWDYTVVRYDQNGTFLGDIRQPSVGAGFDQPMDFTQDSVGNIYITGRGANNAQYDIRTIKLNENYGLEWAVSFDLSGFDDQGNTILVDVQGNVYVGGYATQADNVKNMVLLKYDQNGTLLNNHVFPGENPFQDAEIVDAKNKDFNSFYFLFNDKNKNGLSQSGVFKVDSTLSMKWNKKISSPDSLFGNDLNISSDGDLYASASINGSHCKNLIVRFSEFSQLENYFLDDSLVPYCKDNELIIRFKNSAINKDAVNNNYNDKREIEFASIDYFLTNQAMNSFQNVSYGFCPESEGECAFTAIKLFKQMKTFDTLAINRLGDTVRVPDFWTTFLVVLPSSVGLDFAFNQLNGANDIIAYCEPNLFIEKLSPPNDTYYDSQESLYSQFLYPDGHINMEEGWEVYPEAGRPDIRSGVYDEGINFRHEDFGYDGINTSSSKVRGGFDFESNGSIYNLQLPDDGHGTPVAGIIGAIRNNATGIAGIAGGNFQGMNDFSDKGSSLYAMRIIQNSMPGFFGNPIQHVYDAIVSGSIDDTLSYTFGLHNMNHSWRIHPAVSPAFFIDTNITLLKEATHFANRMNVTVVAARGNEGNATATYPATIDDDWVLSVGGAGTNGLLKDKFNGFPQLGAYSSSYGLAMDVIAPAADQMILTTKAYYNDDYQSFSMTSAAAPHVTGVVNLLQSYLNDTMPAYKNLAPEDCEHILEMTAVQNDTNVNAEGYSESTGRGIIDAGAAMRRVELTYNSVLHFGTNQFSPHSTSLTQVGTMQNVFIKENVQNVNNVWFLKGEYLMNIYRVDAIVNHQLGLHDTIVDIWPRPSASSVFGPILNDSLLPRERIAINSFTLDTCEMSGYLYEVFDTLGNYIDFLPHKPFFPRPEFEYTILARDSTAPNVGVTNEVFSLNDIQLFPNPTNDHQMIVINNCANKKLSITLYDINGRKVMDVLPKKVVHHQNHQQKINVSHLDSGVYFYKIELDNEIFTLKTVKQ